MSFQRAIGQDVASQPTWEEVLKTKQGTIGAVWFESTPFVYKTTDGELKGIEHDLVMDFIDFVKERYDVNVDIEWREAESFSDAYGSVRDHNRAATLALSAFSITSRRDAEVDFSPPYMSDISVLITSDNIPILRNNDEFYKLIPKLSAITIKETTYEYELLRFKTEGNLPFNIRYIPSNRNIMHTIAATDSTFGFIDLPVYMMLFKDNPSVKVKRQNILPIKREGYAIILPEGSDWNIPLKAYFEQPNFKSRLEKIISTYIDMDLYHFVEGLAVHSSDHTVMLLTKEKEIQYEELLGKADIITKETRTKNFLIALMGITLTSLVVIITLYKKRNEQKDQIEAQGKSIALKSKELEQRNAHLVSLDEEKNNLIRILAHDLRTPINHIQGLAQLVLLEKKSLTPEQDMMIGKIVDSSQRLNKMITHLLDIDAIENNRVTLFMEQLDLASVVAKVVGSFEKHAQLKGIPLSFHHDAGDYVVKADSLYLFEIFENLISNAIKFSMTGKQVEISLQRYQTSIRVAVKDNGPGLTNDDKQNLFKKYQRLSARPTAGEASVGLGLSIVKKYVEIMNGNVWCESLAGQGATFIVEFPIYVDAIQPITASHK